jgi:hypothetical protein
MGHENMRENINKDKKTDVDSGHGGEIIRG